MKKTKAKARRPARALTKRRRWLRNVKTVSTFAPRGTFLEDAEHIARVMASPTVSPKGIRSAIQMVQFFLNRGGKGLSAARRRELEKAKRLLQARLAADAPTERRSPPG